MSYPCCRHCTHGPDFVHEMPCQSLIIDGEECQTGTGWWGFYLRKLAAEQLDRQTWIDKLALDWGLIRMPESLTPAQLTAQIDMHLRRQGLTFYPTIPGDHVIIDIPEPQSFPCPRCSATRWHAEMYMPGMAVTCMECGWSEWVAEIEHRMQEGEL